MFFGCILFMFLAGDALVAQSAAAINNTAQASSLLAEYKKEPLPLNKDSLRLLQACGLLNANQIASFSDFVDKYGELYSIDDLAVLAYWDKATISRVRPYLIVHDYQASKKKATTKKENPTKHGSFFYTPGSMKKGDEGRAYQLASSYTYKQKNRYELGILSYKGVGTPYNLSYRRCYFIVEKGVIAKIKRLIVGSYSIYIGQGLVMGTSGSYQNSPQAHLKKTQNIVVPCKSNVRNEGMNGLACHLEEGRFGVVIYAAHDNYYATIHGIKPAEKEKCPDLTEAYFISIPKGNTNYRNQKEYERKSHLKEKVLGGAIIYRLTEDSNIGVEYLFHTYNIPNKHNDRLQKEHKKIGLFGEVRKKSYEAKGELALSRKKDLAFIIGQKILLSKQKNIRLVFEHYSPHFHSLHGKRSSHRQNVALAYHHKRNKTTIDNSTTLTIQQGKKETKKLVHQLSLVHKINQQLSLGNETKITYEQSKKNPPPSVNLKLYTLYKRGVVMIKSMLNMVFDLHYHFSIGFYQSITYTLKSLKIVGHYTLFHSLVQPLYFYVPDIKVPSFPKLIGKGIRCGMTLAYDFKNKLTLKLQAGVGYNIAGSREGIQPTYKIKLAYNS